MKILLTGMTKMQANRPRRREYNTSINAFYNALLEAKHTVDWRPLQYDEASYFKDLSSYGLIILGLGTTGEFSCTYLYESLLATRSKNVLYLVNDWKANGTIRTLMDSDIFRDFVLKNNTGNRIDRSQIRKDEKLIERCREKMFDHNNLVGPFFCGWGNRNIILDGTPFKTMHEFDPSSFYLGKLKSILPFNKRIKQWAYGALADYSKWHKKLNAKWPIIAHNKKSFIPEDELFELYKLSVGILLPKYKASGSGWWRARYCHAIRHGNLIYGDVSEFESLKHEMYHEINDLEKSPLNELQEVAKYQSQTLTQFMPKWKDVVEQVHNIVKACR